MLEEVLETELEEPSLEELSETALSELTLLYASESESLALLLELNIIAAAMIIIQIIMVPQIRINFLLSPVELELSDTTLVFSIGIDSKGLPQLLQNFAESLFAVPHFEHIIYSQPI